MRGLLNSGPSGSGPWDKGFFKLSRAYFLFFIIYFVFVFIFYHFRSRAYLYVYMFILMRVCNCLLLKPGFHLIVRQLSVMIVQSFSCCLIS